MMTNSEMMSDGINLSIDIFSPHELNDLKPFSRIAIIKNGTMAPNIAIIDMISPQDLKTFSRIADAANAIKTARYAIRLAGRNVANAATPITARIDGM